MGGQIQKTIHKGSSATNRLLKNTVGKTAEAATRNIDPSKVTGAIDRGFDAVGDRVGAAGDILQDAGTEIGAGLDTAAEFLRLKSPDMPSAEKASDTSSANYSKTASSSKTDKKGQRTSKGGTGGSRKQFYAKK